MAAPFHMERIAQLATKLQVVPEGRGTTLDTTLLGYLSDSAERHHSRCWDWPMLVIRRLWRTSQWCGCRVARVSRWAAALYCVTASFGAEPDLSRRPNIVVILADDLGYGDLGCFGQKMLKTPALDAIAAEGMRFTQFYAGSANDAASRCVLLTGRHAGHAAVRGNSPKLVMIPPGQPTVASLLKGAGYATACVRNSAAGSAHGFTEPKALGFDHVPTSSEADDASDMLVENGLQFIRGHQKVPFFLYLALDAPAHGARVDDLGEFADEDWPDAEKRFAAMVRDLDRHVGRVAGLLKELGLATNTLVIFTSDNGPHETGGHKAEFFDSNGKFRGIKGGLTEGGIRVPMIAWWPGTVPAGAENDRQWYVGDLLATAAELAGVKPPERLDSDSFVAALRGQPSQDQWKRKSRLYWECYDGATAQAVRFGKWKAMRAPMFTGPIELYDLSNDRGEIRNYAQRRPDLAKHATNLLNEEHESDANRPAPAEEKSSLSAGAKN